MNKLLFILISATSVFADWVGTDPFAGIIPSRTTVVSAVSVFPILNLNNHDIGGVKKIESMRGSMFVPIANAGTVSIGSCVISSADVSQLTVMMMTNSDTMVIRTNIVADSIVVESFSDQQNLIAEQYLHTLSAINHIDPGFATIDEFKIGRAHV